MATAVTTDDGGRALGNGVRPRTGYWTHSTRRATANYTTAAPLPNGRRSVTDDGAERRPPTSDGDVKELGGRRGTGMSLRTSGSPGARIRGRRGPGRPDGEAEVLGRRRPERRGRRRWPRIRLPRLDSFGVEDKHDEAELVAVSAQLGEAYSDGDVCGGHGDSVRPSGGERREGAVRAGGREEERGRHGTSGLQDRKSVV